MSDKGVVNDKLTKNVSRSTNMKIGPRKLYYIFFAPFLGLRLDFR